MHKKKTIQKDILELLNSFVDVTSPVLSDGAATYTPGVSESRTGISTFYGHDRLGSVILQTSSSQAITNQKVYDAFGMLESSAGSTSSPFGFVGALGYQQDADSGLMLLGHRYYDSSIGRFLSRDPVKDSNNWYGYVRNNPLKKVDVNGLTILEILLLGDAVLGIPVPGGGLSSNGNVGLGWDPDSHMVAVVFYGGYGTGTGEEAGGGLGGGYESGHIGTLPEIGAKVSGFFAVGDVYHLAGGFTGSAEGQIGQGGESGIKKGGFIEVGAGGGGGLGVTHGIYRNQSNCHLGSRPRHKKRDK